MKKRIAYISLYFFTVLLIFILQKPLFMLYNGAIEKGFGFTDFLHVMIHGAGLDAAMTGYLTAFPFLLVLISIWFRRFPLKKILWGYYAFVATLVSVIFVADMGLYPFWGFKLDASVFLYIDSPKEALASVSIGFILLRVLAIVLLIVLNTWIFAENNPFGINCCAEEGGSHRSHVADRRRIVYHYPWGSYRVDFQRRSGVFQQRADF